MGWLLFTEQCVTLFPQFLGFGDQDIREDQGNHQGPGANIQAPQVGSGFVINAGIRQRRKGVDKGAKCDHIAEDRGVILCPQCAANEQGGSNRHQGIAAAEDKAADEHDNGSSAAEQE